MKEKLQHKLREPVNEMNVVPGVHTSLSSACKLSDANYITVLSKHETNIYDAKTTTIKVSEKGYLKRLQV